MKILNFILLLLVSSHCAAQSDDEYLDSLASTPSFQNWVKKFQTENQISRCDEEINLAKKDLREKGIPIYEYCFTGTSDSIYQRNLLKECKKMQVFPKGIICTYMCDFAIPPEPGGKCYSELVSNDLKARRGEHFADSIYKAIIFSILDEDPDYYNYSFDFNESGFKNAEVLINNEWVEQDYNGKDTLILDKRYPIKKRIKVFESGKKIEYFPALDIQYSVSIHDTLESFNFTRCKESLDFMGYKEVSSEIINMAKEYIYKKYATWKSATFYNKPIKYEAGLYLYLKN